jgi:antitoxin ParD1/3/4
MPSSYALGDHFEDFIQGQLQTGRYNNASEVVRAGLRLLEDSEKPQALTMDGLRRLILEGAQSGVGKQASEVLDRLEDKYRNMSDVSGAE